MFLFLTDLARCVEIHLSELPTLRETGLAARRAKQDVGNSLYDTCTCPDFGVSREIFLRNSGALRLCLSLKAKHTTAHDVEETTLTDAVTG